MIRKISGVLRTFKREETLKYAYFYLPFLVQYVISLPLARSVNVNVRTQQL